MVPLTESKKDRQVVSGTTFTRLYPMEIPVRIIEKKQVADEVMKVTLAFDGAAFDFQPGQYVRVTVPKLKFPDPRGPGRDFSISCPPNGKAITVTFRTGKDASGFKQTLLSLAPGEKVRISGPYGNIVLPAPYTDRSLRPLVFIAGGIGVSAFRAQILSALVDKKIRRGRMTLLWSATNERNIPYLWELRALAQEHRDRFELVEIFGKRISTDVLKKYAQGQNTDALWQIAGTPDLVKAMRESLAEIKVKPDDIAFEEYFGYKTSAYTKLTKHPTGEVESLTEATSNNIPLYHGLLEALNRVAIVSKTDLEGSITFVNDMFVQVSGYDRSELIGQNHRLIKSGTHSPSFYQEMWRTISRGDTWRGEIRNRTKDGSYYWVDTSIAPVFDENGTPDGYISVRFLITDRKEAQEELEQYQQGLERLVKERTQAFSSSNEALKTEAAQREKVEQELIEHVRELAESDRKKDEFIAILSHELRNPLSQILTTTELARLGLPAQYPALTGHLDTVERQSYTMRRLLDDLLDVSRIMRGKITLRRELINVADCIRKAVDGVAQTTEALGHTFDIDAPEKLLLCADPVRLEQIVINLLNNAVKYSPDGGIIHISTREENGHVQISVKDHGIGISPSKIDTIFELFAQLDSPLRFPKEKDGLGIGLYISKVLAEMHDGTINAKSAGEGAGSEFVVTLPLLPIDIPPHETPESESAAPASKEKKNLKIMVIDDITDLANAITALLIRMGYTARAAYSGESAIAMIDEYIPDIIFLDIGMPGMNGYETLQELKKDPRLAQTKFFAVTGFGQEHDQRRSAESGFTAHLVKPLGARDLQKVLEGGGGGGG
ncbi:response regulator [Candidatus Kaiserbacteria bacterium]|nr:response regulator [Candidatus Kaiserbacteria bacterium]